MNPVLKTLVVIALRHVAPLVGGAGLFSDNEYEQIAGGLILLVSLGYHAWQRHKGKDVPEAMPLSLIQSQSSAMLQPTPVAPTLREQGDQMIRDIVATKPAQFVVGGTFDGHRVVGGITYNRTWKNGLGATAFANAYWNDATVTPLDQHGFVIGGQVTKKFGSG